MDWKWGWSLCLSNKLQGDADAAGRQTPLALASDALMDGLREEGWGALKTTAKDETQKNAPKLDQGNTSESPTLSFFFFFFFNEYFLLFIFS